VSELLRCLIDNVPGVSYAGKPGNEDTDQLEYDGADSGHPMSNMVIGDALDIA
jgi:hypothetical protein